MTIPSSSMQGAAVRMPARFSLIAAAIAATFGQAAAAEDKKLEEMVVTATRTAVPLSKVTSDTVVITSEQLQNFGPGRSVVDVLQRLANVQINSNGGRGQTQSVFIRGSESRHTLLLIDGARHGSASGGSPSFANLPLEQIERIEVIKGPASSLYGSEAIGGVVQIFTKRSAQGVDKPLQAAGSVTLGKNDHRSTNIYLNGAQAGFDYKLGVARILDKGFSVQKPNGSTMDLDKDGFDQTSLNLGLGYQFLQNWRAEASFLQSKGTADYDSGSGENRPFNEMTTRVSRVALIGQVTPEWHSTFSISESLDRSENLDRLTPGSSMSETKQTEFKWEQRLATQWGEAFFAAERLEQKIDTATPVTTPTQRTIDALVLGLNGSTGKHSWQTNIRHDDNSQFGGYTSYGMNYGYELIPGLRAYGAHGRSMRAPSFDDLYSPSYLAWGSPGWAGNPELQPEKSKNFEFGLQYTNTTQRAKIIRYNNKVTNLISQGTGGSDFKRNAPGDTRFKGWTAEYGVHIGNWDVSIHYDKLKARMADGSTPFNRADSQTGLNVAHHINAWTLSANALRMGSRTVYGGKKLSAYSTLDVSAQYQVNPSVAVQARVANVTDREYMLSDGYNQIGRAAYITLKWTPQ